MTPNENSIQNFITVVGAGLAGSECAYQLAEMGHKVVLYEMRGKQTTPAHKTDKFAELVCSNSFGSQTDYSAPGQLKWEAEQLGSLVLKAAKEAQIPAGMALGVDREIFAGTITQILENHPNIEIRRDVIEFLDQIPRPAVIATGPLTDDRLAQDLKKHFDDEFMYFFDAIAPIIDADTINEHVAYKADRFGKGDKDYYNCPMNKEQYYQFVEAIVAARKIEPKDFEKTPFFEGCMPVEAIVDRGLETLRFGPMSPKGLKNPKTGDGAYAVVQLRQENKEATAYNMVGFQTRMAYGEQVRVFRMIPGLEEAEFLKLGSIHRNLYIHSPKKLTKHLSSKKDPWLFFAGQITGVEGYFDSTCIGLLMAHILHQKLEGKTELCLPPRETAFGSLLNAITEEKEQFQPTNINFSLFPLLGMDIRGRKEREKKREIQLGRAKNAMLKWLGKEPVTLTDSSPSSSLSPG